jgi:hypothetical protein
MAVEPHLSQERYRWRWALWGVGPGNVRAVVTGAPQSAPDVLGLLLVVSDVFNVEVQSEARRSKRASDGNVATHPFLRNRT